MHIALGHSLGGVPKKAGDGQFRKAKLRGDARKGMTKNVGRYTGELCSPANAIEHADHADEVAFAHVGNRCSLRVYIGKTASFVDFNAK